MKLLGLLGVLVMLGAGAGMLAGSVITYQDAHSGRPGKVRVTDCTGGATKYGGGIRCTGTWVAGGALVGGNGHVVIGTVENAGYGDLGDVVDVRFHGARATKTSGSPTVILAVLGLLVLGGGVYFAVLWWGSVRPTGEGRSAQPAT